ncbi:MAG: ribbon-helix-helix protein, CopG family [Candidatus Pelagibacter ubique]
MYTGKIGVKSVYIYREVLIMDRIITVRIEDSEYEVLARMAKSQGKALSQLVRELISNGIKQEVKDTMVLSKLIFSLEKYATFTQEVRETKILAHKVFELLKFLGSMVIVIPEKKKFFEEEVTKIEKGGDAISEEKH